MNKNNLLPVLILGISLLSTSLFAQYEKLWAEQLSEEDRHPIEALALYSSDVRKDILVAAQYPQTLIKLKRTQAQSSASFQKLLVGQSQETQQALWDLTRYPGLIQKLSDASKSDRKMVLKDYPEVIHQRALELSKKHPDLLVNITDLQANNQEAFQAIISEYPPRTQAAFQHLTELPEVLTLLTDNIEQTIIVGDLYKNYPLQTLQKMEDLHAELTKQQEEELADWTASIQEDPDAMEEMQRSSEEFSEEYGFDDSYYEEVYDDYETEVRVIERHYYHHYPYWFGYPHWYAYPRWRPFPYWYEWGFYGYPGQHIVFIGMPSYFCMNWYFYYGNHHYHYPHFSSHLVNHHYRHPRSTNSVSTGVSRWKDRNQDIVSDEWLADEEGRVDKLKQLGQLEEDRMQYNDQHGDRPMSKSEFLHKNREKYPDVKPQLGKNQPKDQPKPTLGKNKPKVEEPGNKPPAITPKPRKPDPVLAPAPTPKPRPKVTVPRKPLPTVAPPRPRPMIPKVKASKDYHKNQWERPKPMPKRPTITTPRPTLGKNKPRKGGE